MKKFLILASAVILILGLAATTYAMDWGASGFVRVRSAWYVNAGSTPDAQDDDWDDTNAYMDTRFRLKFTAKANDYASGVIYFEGDSSQWGEDSGTRNAAGFWNADRAAIELKQFYIDFKVPGLSDFAPTTLTAGIQGLSVRSHMFVYTDGPGIKTETTAGPVKIFLNWFKPEEGATWQADDGDIYGAVVSAPGLGVVTPGAYFFYYNLDDYPLRSSTPAGPYDTAAFWYLGLWLDGKVGPVNFKSDFVYFDGEQELSGQAVLLNPLAPDPSYSGWGLFVDANLADLIPNWTFGGTFAYGTGDDLGDTTDVFGNPDEFDAYRIPIGSEEAYGGAWGVVFYPSAVNDSVRIANLGSGTEFAEGKLGGTWFGKLYASFKYPEWMKTTIYGMYIGDTTKDGNTHGNARDPFEVSGFEDESDIGIEVGAVMDFSIYKNLTYSFGAGYLWAGDALDSYTGVTVLGLPQNDSPKNPWAVVSQLIFKF